MPFWEFYKFFQDCYISENTVDPNYKLLLTTEFSLNLEFRENATKELRQTNAKLFACVSPFCEIGA